MSFSRKRMMVLLAVLGITFVLGLGAIVLRWETGFDISKMLLGIMLMGVGLFRTRLRRWMGAKKEYEDIRFLLQITLVSMGIAFTLGGGAQLLNMPPTPVFLIQLTFLVLGLLAALAALVKRTARDAE